MKYKIGEFSKITMLTIKTLRYYHEIGLLIPSDISDDNHYRHYNESQIRIAATIKTLKHYEFSIKEIKEIIQNLEDISDIEYYLSEKAEEFEMKIKKYSKLISEIETLKDKEEAIYMNTNTVINKTIEDINIISITFKGKYSDVGPYFSKLFKAATSHAIGGPFCLYHDGEYKEEATIEVCLQVKKEINKLGIDYKTLKGGNVISLLHVGEYENLGSSYKIITDYIINNNMDVLIPSRELYLKGPGMLLKGNPKKYQTEIQYLY